MIRLAAVAALAVMVSACGGGAVKGGSGVVAPDGRIGSLRIDVSTYADVIAFAGKPDLITTFKTSWPGVPTSRAIGYSCAHFSGARRDPAGYCATVYYVNLRTHRLAAFESDSKAFTSPSGTQPGMATSDVVRREHSSPGGPLVAIVRQAKQSTFAIDFTCSRPGPGCVLDHVNSLRIESRKHPIGLLFT